MYPEESFDEFVTNSNNGFSDFNQSDPQLVSDFKAAEERGSVFVDPYYTSIFGGPRYISHLGFRYLSDLDEYIGELSSKLKDIKEYWKKNGPVLDDLNEKIEKKYANYRNGADRRLDPEIEGLEDDYLRGLEEQEEDLKRIEEINNKIADLLEARKRWLAEIKARTQYTRRKKNELLDQLEHANKELKNLKARQYAGDNSEFVKDRIVELEDIIKNIETQLKDFHKTAGYGRDNTTAGYGRDNTTDAPANDSNKVVVKIDLNGGKLNDRESIDDIILDKGAKFSDKEVLSDPVLDDNHEFEGWTVNGEAFDKDAPINEDITVKANYKVKEHTVTYLDEKGNVVETIKVKHGEHAPNYGEEKLNKKRKKLFKEFNGWKRVVETDDEIVSHDVNLDEYEVNSDVTFQASYKWDKQLVVGTAAAVVASGIAIGIDAARRAADPLSVPYASGGLAVVNGSLWLRLNNLIKKGKEPDLEAERNATGIKRLAIKGRNKALDPNFKWGLKRYLGLSSVLSAGGAAAMSIGTMRNLLAAPEVAVGGGMDPVPDTPDVTYVEQEVFKGIDPSQKIYVDPEASVANGKPLMQYFDHDLQFFANGKEIIPGQTPVSEITGPVKIVEIQPDGSKVTMGTVNNFLTEVVKVAKEASGSLGK